MGPPSVFLERSRCESAVRAEKFANIWPEIQFSESTTEVTLLPLQEIPGH